MTRHRPRHWSRTTSYPLTPTLSPSGRGRSGFTILEMAIVIIIMGVLLTLVLPSFNRIGEQTRLDGSAQYLRSIWAAERIYWLENRAFTNSLASLDALGVLDPKIATGTDGSFDYEITAADATTFSARATRSGSTVWSGQITITQDGQVAGTLTSTTGTTLTPSQL